VDSRCLRQSAETPQVASRGVGWTFCRLLVLAAGFAVATCACAHELLVFPRAEVLHTEARPGEPEATEWIAAASLFYANDWRQLRALVELNLVYTHAPSEIEREKEFERAQLGWRFNPNNTVWFGRYHTPIGYWNTAHHHGAHLQTSISRPRIHEFEDDGGILPVHFFGLLLQGIQSSHDGTLSYDVGAASGPTLRGEALEPVEVLAPQHFGKPSFVGRIAWRPDVVAESEIGGFAAHSRIPVADLLADEIGQTIAGAYANLDLSRWRLVGEVFWVRNAFRSTENASSFVAGLVEAEYRAGSMWVLFARHEALGARSNDAYLARFPDFPKARSVGGVRFDITHHQALTFEVANHKRRDGVQYLQTALQWSTALP
jgi:hypothetical protein